MRDHRFAPAAPDEEIVFGACRPGRFDGAPESIAVEQWIQFMQNRDIERICCLLDEPTSFDLDLLSTYRDAFGPGRVCHAPIPDFEFVGSETLYGTIVPFLKEASERSEPVVVHCSAGSGRTGHVLVAWLVCERNFAFEEALEAVRKSGRNPTEAGHEAILRNLLADCLLG